MDANSDLNAKDRAGFTPLHHAAFGGDLGKAFNFSSRGKNVEQRRKKTFVFSLKLKKSRKKYIFASKSFYELVYV